MRTSLRAPLWLLEAAAARGRLGPTKPGGGCGTAPRPGGGLLWSHCALIRSRSWLSSIPVPSSCSAPPPPPAADEDAAVANKASQEPARCSCRARAACKQPTRRRDGEGGGASRAKEETQDREVREESVWSRCTAEPEMQNYMCEQEGGGWHPVIRCVSGRNRSSDTSHFNSFNSCSHD